MEIGDTIKYGFYPQNTKEPEPIEWIIIQQDEDTEVLLSKYVLDCQIFDKPNNKCGLTEIENWLENVFKKTANLSESPSLLPINIAKKLEKNILICEPTEYAKKTRSLDLD
jgi:5'-3' exonuclease